MNLLLVSVSVKEAVVSCVFLHGHLVARQCLVGAWECCVTKTS